MARLSININKVATLRNSRGGEVPSVLEAVEVCVAAGAPGITVHPREDERHIRPNDVYTIADALEAVRDRVEYNIEGDPRPGLIEMVERVRPDQCTLVPVRPGEVTSEAGWPADTPKQSLREIIARFQEAGVRVSVFVNPDPAPIDWAAELGADRVELYTEPYARAFEQGGRALASSLERFGTACRHAHELGLGINAGHDLDLENLPTFLRLPHIDEVSIGHALISRALFVGLGEVVSEYLRITSR
ncbi:MAG: pyridoxine 5'-phosphate synthase [Myxococcales bacterium]|nr:pyridoxine 5'-phosphate synthase [Myxococcales bacterium]MDH3484618.1 pyridoxine 5'-phosphate synthase [Myxococcales bacterium]